MMILRLLLMSIFVISGVGYSQTPQTKEERATSLVQQSLHEELFVRSSYESVEMKLDSAFSPFDSPEYFDKLVEINKLGFKAVAMYKVRDNLEKLISLYESKSSQARHISKQTYLKTRDRYRALTDSINLMVEQINILSESVAQSSEERAEFIGFKATHTYKVVDRDGQILRRKQYLLYDKDISKIIASYNLNDEAVERTLWLIEMITGKNESPGDDLSSSSP